MGSWEVLAESSEVPAVHAALLPSGEVVYYSGNEGFPAEARVWDPVSGTVYAPPNAPNTDLFCSGLALTFDGRLFVVGGTEVYSTGPGIPWIGSKSAFLFEPTGGWQRVQDMSFGRWYPSAICLPDGRILVASGEGQDGGRTQRVEIYDLQGGWEVLPASANRYFPLYPRLHLLPSGEVSCTGQGGGTALLDLQTNRWREFIPAGDPQTSRDDDLCVLLNPLNSSKVLHCGGITGGGVATANAEIIDFADPNPAWRPVPPMNYPRWFPNSALLPDGKLFVVGGGQLHNADPVMEPEIFDPQTEAWTVDTPMTVRRLYHSTALLLPDGRVWVAGTDGEMQMEVFSPDYLLAGARPVIGSAPGAVAYGQYFLIPVDDAQDIASVRFIRLGAVTHAYNTEQRYVPLEFTVNAPGQLEITAPTDLQVAPPGYYMLFISNSAGVPAVAPIVQLLAV